MFQEKEKIDDLLKDGILKIDLKPFENNIPIKYILFDKKKSYGQTLTNMRITPIKKSYDNKELFIYRIHHPNEKRSLNIKLLT